MDDPSVDELYSGLNKLLEDICKFLSGDTFQTFSSDDKQIASELIHRTKKQLEDIPKLLPKTNENEEYVDMSKKNKGIIDKKRDNKHQKDDHTNQDNTNYKSTIITSNMTCPYKDLPADVTSKDVKSGHLWIRRRIFLKQKVFVSIRNDWLLIYVNDNASKPCHCFNLKLCKAREGEKNSRSFVLVSFKNEEKKNYIFMTKMPEEVAGWVKIINNTDPNEQANIRDEEYDIIEPKADVEENIYNEPEMICSRLHPKLNETDNNDTKPPLPPGRGLILPSPLWRNSRTSVVSYHEVEDQSQEDIPDKINENTNIFDSVNFERNNFKFSDDERQDVIKIARNFGNTNFLCPLSKMQTFKSNTGEI